MKKFQLWHFCARAGVSSEFLFFLTCNRSILPCVERLGSTTFHPVKADVLGNINKIEKAHLADPEHRFTLEAIMREEMATNTTKVANSATDALLWLRRALSFLCALLAEVMFENLFTQNRSV